MNLEEINKRIKVEMDLRNNQPVEEFEGRTPKEMYYILYNTYHPDSPFQFSANVSSGLLDNVPLLKMTTFFLETLQESQSIKLTPKGNLPLKYVKPIYELGLFPNRFIDSGYRSLRSEEDSHHIHVMRLLCQLTGLVKKRSGKLSLTAKGKTLLKQENRLELFKDLFVTYTTKFSWAYNDRYGDHPVGQLGFAFSVELVAKYGRKKHPAEFYGYKYVLAFPKILDYIDPHWYTTAEDQVVNCFSLRTFEFFMNMFGLVELEEVGEDRISARLYVKKTPLLDQVFEFRD
jgi:hypothetical protein